MHLMWDVRESQREEMQDGSQCFGLGRGKNGVALHWAEEG